MQEETKNQKISKIAAKAAIRIFILVVFMGALPFISGEQPWSVKLHNAQFIIPNKWTLIYPALLFLGMLALTILVLRNKYKAPDYNWLLVLNAVVLLTYLVLVYIRIYKLIFV